MGKEVTINIITKEDIINMVIKVIKVVTINLIIKVDMDNHNNSMDNHIFQIISNRMVKGMGNKIMDSKAMDNKILMVITNGDM
jgi:hypothetical protein